MIDCRNQTEPLGSAISEYVLSMAIITAVTLAAIAASPEIELGLAGAALLNSANSVSKVKALMATFGLSSLVLSVEANAGPNDYAYPAGTKICGGGTCGTPTMYRGATDECPWPNMDCIRKNDINPGAKSIENGVEYIDPMLMRKNFKDGISTFDKPTSNPYVTGGWYAYPEEDPTGIPIELCVVAGAGGHWAWQPKTKMSTDSFKVLLKLTHPKFNKVN